MRAFRPTFKARDGSTRTARRWAVEVKDRGGILRRLAAFTDRGASEALGRRLEQLAARGEVREAPDRELSLWVSGLSAKMREKLARFGFLDVRAVEGAKALSAHVAAFVSYLESKRVGARHLEAVKQNLERMFEKAKIGSLHEATPGRLQGALAAFLEKGLAPRTVNTYRAALRGFFRWAVRERLAVEDPTVSLVRFNEAVDVRRVRRALSTEEIGWLLRAAERAPARFNMEGRERALYYRLALESGLRAGELRTLTRGSFDLDGKPPTVTVRASCSKNGKEATLPLRADTAALLAVHLEDRLPAALAFAAPSVSNHADMLREDLRAARAAWIVATPDKGERRKRWRSDTLRDKDSSGRILDFHGLRHSFLSALARSGVHPKVAQVLARHSSVTLTLDRYTHTAMESLEAAVEALPAVPSADPERAAVAAGGEAENPPELLGVLLGVPSGSDDDAPSPSEREDGASGGSRTHNRPLTKRGLCR